MSFLINYKVSEDLKAYFKNSLYYILKTQIFFSVISWWDGAVESKHFLAAVLFPLVQDYLPGGSFLLIWGRGYLCRWRSEVRGKP